MIKKQYIKLDEEGGLYNLVDWAGRLISNI